MNPLHIPEFPGARLVFPLVAWMGFSASLAGADDWPQWRGPDRSNASRESGLLAAWPTNGPPLLWRATGIGLGIHPVTVAGGRVFVVGNREGGEFVFALESQSGEKAWATRVDNSIPENALMRWLTQRSPTVDGDRLYLLTVNGELCCLRVADGKKIWQTSYPKDFEVRRPGWGFTDHPLVDGERIICSPYATNAAIAALNKHTGAVIWQSPLGERIVPGYASLVHATNGGVRQFILFHGTGLAGFAADDGRLLWRYARTNARIASSYTPIVREDRVLSPNGYSGGLALFKVIRDETGFTTAEVTHQSMNLDPFQDATAAVGDEVYLIAGGHPACVDAKTGAILWSQASTNRAPRAALTWAEGHLYVRNAQGQVRLVQVTSRGMTEKGRFLIPEHETSVGVTSPVIAGQRLWLRDNNRLFCYDVSASAATGDRLSPAHRAIGLTDAELGADAVGPRPPRTGVDRAPDAVFVPTPHDIVERMLEEAGLKPTEVMLALGSGDGRFVLAAAKKFGARAIGYEIDARLVEQSRAALTRENLGARARIEHQDIFTLDLSGGDVITVFLYPRLMERLIPQFDQLKPGSRIVSHQFEIPGVKPDKMLILESKEDGDKHRVFLWTTPLKKETRP